MITVYPNTKIEKGHMWSQNGKNLLNSGNVVTNAEENVTMACNIKNYDSWKNENMGNIRWLKDGKDISSNTSTRFIFEDNSFTINKLIKNDSGN